MISYSYRYNRVIQWFKTHKISEDVVCEIHHIVPKSIGGDDSSENLVNLPIRWHYIVHCWLPAMYAEQGNQDGYEKMLFAWNRMQNYRTGHRAALRCIKEDSELYRKLRESYIKVSSRLGKTRIGEKNAQFKHHWWKDPNDRSKSMSIKEGDPVPEGWIKGRWYSEETLKTIKNNNHNRGKICITNQLTGERKYIKKDEKMLYGPDWVDGYSIGCSKGRYYTFDGMNKFLVRKNEIPPIGSISVFEWRKKHPSFVGKKRMSKDEIIKRKIERSKQYVEWVKQQLPIWIEMYKWYLDNGENFSAMCNKYGYTKSRDAFLARARKYFPEIFKWNPHGGVRGSRPKTRGPYNKKRS